MTTDPMNTPEWQHPRVPGDERFSEDVPEADADEARRLLADLADLTVWMTGSADFGPEGQAHAGWVKGRPALNRALAYLEHKPREELLKELERLPELDPERQLVLRLAPSLGLTLAQTVVDLMKLMFQERQR
jgi:hypothetical protein